MQRLVLGSESSKLRVSRIAYGCSTLGGTRDATPPTSEVRARAVRALAAALECGIDFFDHADIYCRGKSESVFASALRELGVSRSKIFLQSKCGIRVAGDGGERAPYHYDLTREHIVRSAEQSLRRLETDYLDVYLLHRPDPLVEPDEVAAAFDELFTSGKVRTFGVSNHTAYQIELLTRSLRQPLVANQVELSLVHPHPIDSGLVMNQGRAATGVDGLLDYCRLRGITPQAWRPLGSGRALGGGDDERSRALSAVVRRLAREKGVREEAIPIAWLLRHPARLQPVIGTTDPVRIRGAASADGVELTREEWFELYEAARGERLP
jgi:predicted oxidoreductase